MVSGPKARYRVTAEIPRLRYRPRRPATVRLETGRPDTSDTLARLLVGPLQSRWTWRGGAWVATLSHDALDERFHDTEADSAGFTWAQAHLDDLAELTRSMELGESIPPEQDRVIALRITKDEGVLDWIAQTLTEHIAKTRPAIVFRIGDHLDSSHMWLALLRAPHIANRALERLLTRWPGSDAENHAIEHALIDPLSWGETQLELVFEALDRRRDGRLAEVLMRLIDEPALHHRKMALSWLERRGDATMLEPLRALQARCAKERVEPIARTIAAIQFRLAQALKHTLGGLSIANGGGTLTLAEEHYETSRT